MSAELPENSSPISDSSASTETSPLKPAPPRRKILIGTQRPGVLDAMRAAADQTAPAPAASDSPAPESTASAPEPVAASPSELQSQPVEAEKPAEIQAQPVLAEPKPVEPKPVEVKVEKPASAPQKAVEHETKAEVPQPEETKSESEAAEKSENSDDRRGGRRDDRRDSRGRKREPKVDPIQQILASAPLGKVSKIPVPTARTPMSDDLEAEYAAALGDLTGLNGLDNIISNAVTAGVELEQDDKVEATVVRIVREDVILDLGNFNQGVASLRQFTETPEAGTKIKVTVVRYNSAEGLYEVTLPNAAAVIGDWSQVEEGIVVDVAVTGQNTGGLECEVARIRAFMPAGQVSIYHRDNFDDLIGTHLMAVVLEAKPEKRNLVVSHKAFELRQQETEKKEFLAALKEGEAYDAVVRKIMPFGCFVDLGHGVEGLVHVSRLSWGHITDPAEVVKEGEMIKVVFLKVDDKGKLSFSRRDTIASPWELAPSKYAVSTVCNGKIVKIEQFGAFVELEPGVEGLLHISELAHQRIGHVSDVVKVGQEVQVQVLSLDPMARKIGLSMKSLIAPPVKEEPAEGEENAQNAGKGKGKKEKPEDLEAQPLSKKFRNKNVKDTDLKGGTSVKGAGKWSNNFSAFLINSEESDK